MGKPLTHGYYLDAVGQEITITTEMINAALKRMNTLGPNLPDQVSTRLYRVIPNCNVKTHAFRGNFCAANRTLEH